MEKVWDLKDIGTVYIKEGKINCDFLITADAFLLLFKGPAKVLSIPGRKELQRAIYNRGLHEVSKEDELYIFFNEVQNAIESAKSSASSSELGTWLILPEEDRPDREPIPTSKYKAPSQPNKWLLKDVGEIFLNESLLTIKLSQPIEVFNQLFETRFKRLKPEMRNLIERAITSNTPIKVENEDDIRHFFDGLEQLIAEAMKTATFEGTWVFIQDMDEIIAQRKAAIAQTEGWQNEEPTSKPTPELTPKATPELTPKSTPELTPNSTPEPTSEPFPTPLTIPEPFPTPLTIPEPFPTPTPELVPASIIPIDFPRILECKSRIQEEFNERHYEKTIQEIADLKTYANTLTDDSVLADIVHFCSDFEKIINDDKKQREEENLKLRPEIEQEIGKGQQLYENFEFEAAIDTLNHALERATSIGETELMGDIDDLLLDYKMKKYYYQENQANIERLARNALDSETKEEYAQSIEMYTQIVGILPLVNRATENNTYLNKIAELDDKIQTKIRIEQDQKEQLKITQEKDEKELMDRVLQKFDWLESKLSEFLTRIT